MIKKLIERFKSKRSFIEIELPHGKDVTNVIYYSSDIIIIQIQNV